MKALLVIDIQNGLTKKRPIHEFSLFTHTINSSINAYREAGNLIVFIQHNNKQLKELTDDWKIDDRIDKRDSDLTIQKNHGSAFSETILENILSKRNIKEIVVCGLVSHGCVRATCLEGLRLGFQTALLKNGHTNWNKDAENKKKLVETELFEKGIEIIEI
jgi:nicotinamidase-related amidase